MQTPEGYPITTQQLAEEIGLKVAKREIGLGDGGLSDYLSAFWIEGSKYIKKKKAEKEPLSAIYILNSRSAIKMYVIPWLKKVHPDLSLTSVLPGHLEDLKQHLVDLGLGPARCNGVVKAVRVPLGDAWRRGELTENPASKVKKLPDAPPKRRILEIDEARRFFALKWKDPRMYAANLTAALAGLRLGEIRGLQQEDVREERVRVGRKTVARYSLHVCHNWQDWEAEGEKLKGPKHHTEARPKFRDVPIPARLADVLRAVAEANPFGDGFVFWGYVRGEPPSMTLIEESLRAGLVAIGITREEQKARRLTFHAFRHWYNTNMRALNLPGYQLRMLTGHSSEELTDLYTEITDEQRAAIGRVSERLLE